MKGYDVLHAGIATHFLPLSEKRIAGCVSHVQQSLDKSDQTRNTLNNCVEIQDMLNSLQQEYLDNLTDRKIVETEFAANIDAISEIFYQVNNLILL